MEQAEQWTEQLQQIEEQFGEIYERLSDLKREFKDAGLKKHVGALDQVMQQLGKYGFMLGEMRNALSGEE